MRIQPLIKAHIYPPSINLTNPITFMLSRMAAKRGIFVVAGYGNGQGTGSASAAAFANAGYKVAIIGRERGDNSLQHGAQALKITGTDVAAFPIRGYDNASIHDAFEAIKKQWPNEPLRVALWNASFGAFKAFLDTTPEMWEESAEINIKAPAAFARECILTFKNQDLTPEGAKGTLLFTGATASIRGNKTTSVFAAGKHALRALAQSLAKEFGKENIHVAHTIIDGGILTDRSLSVKGEDWVNDPDVRLDPNSIAKSYIYLAHQDRSSWTWELDLRPAHETW